MSLDLKIRKDFGGFVLDLELAEVLVSPMYGFTGDDLAVLRAADACFSEEIREGGYAKRLWQYYTNLVDSPDQPGTYAVSLRALQVSQGGAMAARLAFDVLERASERIRSEVKGVARVVYDLTPSNHYGEME